jgi:microcystin-dependent protein
MTANSPPYAIQASSHSAQLFRQAITTLIASAGGIVNPGDYAVAATATPSMAVTVAGGVPGGQIWVPGTSLTGPQAAYMGYNDGQVTLTIAASNPSNPRIDVPVAQVQDAAYAGATNSFSLSVVTGTPGGSPVAPSIPASSIGLADVLVPASATSITSGNITPTAPQLAIRPALITGIPPIGAIMPYAFQNDPAADATGIQRFLLADGRQISRTTYATFYAGVGNAYGAGNGSTTFNIPDLRGSVPIGQDNMSTAQGAAGRLTTANGHPNTAGGQGGTELHQLTVAELATHNHALTDPDHVHSFSGASLPTFGAGGYNGAGSTGAPLTQTGAAATGITLATAGSSTAHENMIPYQVMNYIIRVL